MAISSHSFSLVLLSAASLMMFAVSANRCDCLQSYPTIKFPFRYRSQSTVDSGYPGFEVSCSSTCLPVLSLPTIPIKFVIKEIDYWSQELDVSIQDYHPWLAQRLSFESLNLSGSSPFRFKYGFSLVTLLNCSRVLFDTWLDNLLRGHSHYFELINDEDIMQARSEFREEPEADCIDMGSNHSLCAIDANSRIEDKLQEVNCTKLYDFNVPVNPSYADLGIMSLVKLTWSNPNCMECELQGMECRLKENGNKNETECYDPFGEGNSSIKLLVIAGSTLISCVAIFMVIASIYSCTIDKKDRENQQKINKFLEDYIALKPSRYTYATIKKITDQFKNKLGQGAFGTVFKGKLSSNIYVAVKIPNNDITKGNIVGEFINEVSTMGRIHHVNVVRLVGYCADGYRRALIYEFLPNDSLDKYIMSRDAIESGGANQSLSWEKLQGIALGTAKGIEYLHQGCDQRILHFDIKPHNILLDENFSPKIADFGLAKLCSKDQSIVSMTTARGTMGYIAPEVFSRNFGNVSYKSDIYSFGMLLLEMVGGRKNTSETEEGVNEIYYPEWIYNLLEGGDDLRIQIEEEGDGEIAMRLAIVGLWCIQWNPMGRPSMKVVVQMLEGREELTMPPNPFASTPSSNTTRQTLARRVALELEAIAE